MENRIFTATALVFATLMLATALIVASMILPKPASAGYGYGHSVTKTAERVASVDQRVELVALSACVNGEPEHSFEARATFLTKAAC
ncbi:hypothetical protein [Afifella sp. IM 167]|uniref:hypothetical protein n=1 Tax=Afifella sp. IM 167 TaxID=2033586 RepID=UPI001CCD61A1|nr:hypothetical protein [Afifella sp. IM 167]MBZ8132489.1 hypothetical protein [Afifella sp. IM 167]